MRITHLSPLWAGVFVATLALATLPFTLGQTSHPAITLVKTDSAVAAA